MLIWIELNWIEDFWNRIVPFDIWLDMIAYAKQKNTTEEIEIRNIPLKFHCVVKKCLSK